MGYKKKKMKVLLNLENKINALLLISTHNVAVFEKINKVQELILKKIDKLEVEYEKLKNDVLELKKQNNISQNNKIFVFIVLFDDKNNHHKVFTIENPIFNEKMTCLSTNLRYKLSNQTSHELVFAFFKSILITLMLYTLVRF